MFLYAVECRCLLEPFVENELAVNISPHAVVARRLEFVRVGRKSKKAAPFHRKDIGKQAFIRSIKSPVEINLRIYAAEFKFVKISACIIATDKCVDIRFLARGGRRRGFLRGSRTRRWRSFCLRGRPRRRG